MPSVSSVEAPRSLRTGPLLAAALVALAAAPAEAYVGPGAGIALLSSVGVVLVTLLLAIASILAWPFRALWRLLTGKKTARPWARRFISVGLDGQDPLLTERLMAEGKLPNLKRLAEQGCYHRIRTTYPSMTPVAWSSYSTGVNPGKHNIFDFLDRDRKTYLPVLSSAEIGSVDRFLRLGKWKIPLRRPEIRLLRKSRPFWSILGDYRIWSTVLRMPITFPPDRFYGAELSAMSVPDLLGSQGTFLFFTTRRSDSKFKEGGQRVVLEGGPDRFSTVVRGPENIFRAGDPPLEIPMEIELDRAAGRVRIRLDGDEHLLAPRQLTGWVKLTFRAAPTVKVQGITRLMVTELDEHFSLYLSPINLDPESPAMPISHPSYYSTYMAKKVGTYSTLGLAEDTWALNEKVTDDATFLRQSYDIDTERQEMFFAALDKLDRGSLVCVFDGTDRIQHMFWRYHEEGHPAGAGREQAAHRHAVEEVYLHNDRLVGKVMSKLRRDDVLIVLSDHGFTSFRRGVNLNGWLLAHGYLALKPGCDGSTEWLRDVDWSRTRAYAQGLTGIFLNVEGREGEGIVKPGAEARALRKELIQKLSGLRDDERGEVGINQVYAAEDVYDGPYLVNAPDLIVGYNHGYRVSWDCATGVASGPLFQDNLKAWSGDHCVDPNLVPGVFFCNHAIDKRDPALIDVAPTVLRLFGVDAPPHMDGKPLFEKPPATLAPSKASREGGETRAA
ncbi:MAG: type phosphodiesterase/nucleotide pyrophosphatase [Acidobacteria bacterium]|nr:type phosphodiesterase/nucleotide pyrophosphatase [Acidobacteriota bacterium]